MGEVGSPPGPLIRSFRKRRDRSHGSIRGCALACALSVAALNACVGSQGPYLVIDRSGRAVRRDLQFANPFAEGLASARVGERWGFLHTSGRWAIPPRYQAAASYSEGLAWARLPDGGAGYIDHKGAWVIGPSGGAAEEPRPEVATRPVVAYGSPALEALMRYPMGEVHEGMLPVRLAGEATIQLPGQRSFAVRAHKLGFADRLGRLAVLPAFDQLSRFEQGLAEVWFGSPLAQAVIDTRGSYVVAPQHQHFAFRSGLTCLRKGAARVLVNAHLDSIRDISEYVLLQVGLGRKGIVLGAPIQPHSPEDAPCVFHDGLMPVMKNGRWGFIDSRGELVIALAYDEVRRFADGLAPVRHGARWGAVDKLGHWVVPPRFADPVHFSEGLAAARRVPNGPLGFIDKRGEFVIEPRFSYADEFSHGRAVVSETPVPAL